jgi:hypothetical protein
LLTPGRLKELTTPSDCSVASIVAPFIGPSLSACSASWPGSTPQRSQACATSAAESSADSWS